MVKYQFNPIHGASDDKLSIIYYFTEKILIYFKIVLLIQSQHGVKKKKSSLAATPSSPLTTASQTDHRNTRKNKKMRPVPQKTGCVHIRGKIPLIVMHM